jgi:hypothetical protein
VAEERPLDVEFTTVLQGDMGPHKWVCAILDDSQRLLGTGTARKVTATVDGIATTTSMLPYRGAHMLPVKQAVLDAIGKGAGDSVVVHLSDPGPTG